MYHNGWSQVTLWDGILYGVLAAETLWHKIPENRTDTYATIDIYSNIVAKKEYTLEEKKTSSTNDNTACSFTHIKMEVEFHFIPLVQKSIKNGSKILMQNLTLWSSNRKS